MKPNTPSSIKLHNALTHPAVFTTLAAFLIVTLVLFVFVSINLSYLTGSIAGVLLLAYLYGKTYFPNLKPENKFDYSFDLLKTLSRHPDPWQALQKDRYGRKVFSLLSLKPPQVEHLNLSHHDNIAREYAQSIGAKYIDPEIFIGAILSGENHQKYLRDNNTNEKDVKFVVEWVQAMRRNEEWRRSWWRAEKLLAVTGIGLDWTAGYTPLLDRFARMPVANIWDTLPIGRETQVEQVTTSLARDRQSNVLLVGQPGSGRVGIAYEIRRQIMHSQSHPLLNGQRVIYLHLGEIAAQANSGAGRLSFISAILDQMEHAGNIVVFIDGLSSLVSSGETNITDILLPFFQSSTTRVCVIVSSDEYHSRIKNNGELMQYFDVVQVPSLEPDATIKLLARVAPSIEKKTGIALKYQPLKHLVDATRSIQPNTPYPERAFDVLEEVLVQIGSKNKNELEVADIDKVISQKVGVNIGKVEAGESNKLLQLQDNMHQRVVNQVNAIKAVSQAMIRSRAGVNSGKKPVGTFLFLGPTGVGKTETAKTLAESFYGSEARLNRIDMAEFQNPEDIDKLIGSAQNPNGRLTSLIADHPYSAILFDEFEKAHSSVHQLFLPMLDEGYLTDWRGAKYSFINAILIATSNAGAELIRTSVRDNGTLPNNFDEQLREHILTQNIYRPELLNRFDGVITFTPLTRAHIAEIARKMLTSLNTRLDDEHGITVSITDNLISHLVKTGYNPEFGARPMQRAIQDSVENPISEMILKNQVTPGQPITIL